ncbi:hypothetical protein ACFLQL_02530 [Verrucomicrobiota bacterium]
MSTGGDIKETVGRKCICNCLPANVGLGQNRPGNKQELALVTSGNNIKQVNRLLKPGREFYTAEEVIQFLQSGLKNPENSAV